MLALFLREAKRRASEHHSTPQRSSKHSGMPPKPYPPHSDPQTLVSVAEYNYLGEVVVFSERWWGDDPQLAFADPRQLHITQVTPPHIPSPIFDPNKLVAGDHPAPDLDPPGAQEAPAFCGRTRCAPTAAAACIYQPSPPLCCWHR